MNRDANTIMRDFEIAEQRQSEIEDLQRTKMKFVDAKCPGSLAFGTSRMQTRRQSIPDAERVISDIKTLSNDSLDVTEAPVMKVIKAIDAENLAEQIKDAKKLDGYIEEYKIDAAKLLESATRHYQMM